MKTITDIEWYKLSVGEASSFTGVVKWWDGIEYRKNGLLHRLDGPAITYHNGYALYYINDVEFSMEDYYKHPEVKRHITKNSKKFQDVLKYKNL